MASSALSRDSSTKSIRSLKKESTISIAHECTKAPVTRKTSWTLEMPGSKTIKKKRFFAKKNAVLILDSILHHKNYSLQYGSSSEQPLIKSSDTKKKVDLEKGLSIPSLKFSLSDSDIITMPEENNTTNDLPPVSHHEFGHNKSTDHFTQQFAPLPKHGSVKSKGESEGSFFSPKKTFKMAHASFRNRIHREMYGLETVFMTKKRTRDTKSSEFQGGDLNKYTSRTYAIQNGNEIFGANIQNEFGICGWILTILSYILIFLTLPISACMCIKVVQEYERAVIFRLGRLMPGGAKGPGIFFIVPCIDTYRKVDLRVLSFEVPPQEILSKDSVTVAVDAVVYFRISNATISVTNVEDCSRSTKLLAQTTLRNILGTKTLAEMLSDREAISLQMQATLDEATEPWGVKVERVEVKDVRLPVQLQRAMAAEAEAAREARAKVIVAEGEKKASRALKEAAEVIAESPSALQLRYLQTLNSISAEKNSTIIFPFPIDLLSSFLTKPTPKLEPPPVTKKIRSCCMYKYPDWVQNISGTPGQGGGNGVKQPTYQGFRTNITGGDGINKYPSSEHKSLKAPTFNGNRIPVPSSTSHTSETNIKSITNNIKGLYGPSNKPITKSSSNILLKQALANRINNPQLNEGSSKDIVLCNKDMKKSNEKGNNLETSQQFDELFIKNDDVKNNKTIIRKNSDEMSSSILLSPAWYRDSEGKTGVKEKEWEKLPNQQKCPIKHKKYDKTKSDKYNYEVENICESIKDDFQKSTLSDKCNEDKSRNKLEIKNNEINIDQECKEESCLQVFDNNEYFHTNQSKFDNFKNNRKLSINSENSKISNISRKSVTFSDQVVINEISRRLDGDQQIDFKFNENYDDSLYSDEETLSTLTAVTIIKNKDDLPPTHIDPSLEISRKLQKEFNEYNNDNVFSKQPFLLGPNVEKSIYFDETLGANVYLLEDNSSEDEYLFDSASLNLPESVKRALKAEALARKKDISNYERDITIGCLYGSMSRLHAEDSPNISLNDLSYNNNNVSRKNSYKKKKKEISINDRAYDGEAGESSKLTTEIGNNVLENIEVPIQDNKIKQSKNNKLEQLMEGKINEKNLSPITLSPTSLKKEYKKKKKKIINDLPKDSSSLSLDSEYNYNEKLSTITGSPNPSYISKVSNKSSLNAQKPPSGNISLSRSNSITLSNSINKQNDSLNDNNFQIKNNQPKLFIRSASGYFESPDLSKHYIHNNQVVDKKNTTKLIDNEKECQDDIININKKIPKLLPLKESGGECIQRSYYDNVSYGGVFTPPENIINTKNLSQKKDKLNENKELELPKLGIIVINDETIKNNELEEIYKKKFMNVYSKRKAPLVIEESEEITPKDPDHSYNYGLGPDLNIERKGSMTSNSSRESVISATSYKAEIKVRRNFNY